MPPGYRLAPAALAAAGLLLTALLVTSVAAAPSFTRESAPIRDAGSLDAVLSADCALDAFDTCSGWTWIFTEYPGAVWGAILDPDDCPGGCFKTLFE